MAHGAILGQQPKIDGIAAVIENLPIASGQSVAAGDVVDVVSGEVTFNFAANTLSSTIVSDSGSTGLLYGIAAVGNYSVTIRGVSGGTYLKAVYTETGMPPLGTSTSGDSLGRSNSTAVGICNIGENKLIAGCVSSNRLYIRTASVAETGGVATGTEFVAPGSFSSVTALKFVALSTEYFLAITCGSSKAPTALLCKLNDNNTITAVVSQSIPDFSSGATTLDAVVISSEADTWRVALVYNMGTNGYYNFMDVTAGATNSIAFSGSVQFASDSPISVAVDKTDDGIVIAYANAASEVLLLTVSSGLASDVMQLGDNDEGRVCVNVLCGACAVSWSDTAESKVAFVDLSQQITVATIKIFGASRYGVASSAVNDSMLVFTCSASPTPSPLRFNAVTYTDISSQAIALQSGTEGQSIDIIYSGITNADFVTEGQTITSDGVYGAGVLDGVLQVWSKDRPLGLQIETGSYAGTGKYGESTPNTLSFGFRPQMVIIESVDDSIFRATGNSAAWYWALLVRGVERIYSASSGQAKITFTENGVSWYSPSSNGASAQLNASGCDYLYLAIG